MNFLYKIVYNDEVIYRLYNSKRDTFFGVDRHDFSKLPNLNFMWFIDDHLYKHIEKFTSLTEYLKYRYRPIDCKLIGVY